MKKHWNALIIDDERLARKDLLSQLEAHSDIKVIGEAEDVPPLKQPLQSSSPILFF